MALRVTATDRDGTLLRRPLEGERCRLIGFRPLAVDHAPRHQQHGDALQPVKGFAQQQPIGHWFSLIILQLIDC